MRVVVTEAHPRELEADAVVQPFEPPFERGGLVSSHLSTRADDLIVPDPLSLTWLEPRRMKAPRLILASTGERPAVDAPGWNGLTSDRERAVTWRRTLRSLGAVIERGCFANDVGHLVLAAPDDPEVDLVPILEGILLRAYGPTEFRRRDIATTLGRVTVCVGDRRAEKPRIDEVVELVRATNLARKLADLPSNEGYPQAIVDRVLPTAHKAGLHAEVLDEVAMEELKMGLALGVNRGAGHPGRILVLEHRPDIKRAPTLVLVGKGLTHDTGGYNLKTADTLHELTYDKAGGMAVIGAMHGIARLGVPARVIGVVPLLENCIDGLAYKPGDILQAMDRTTVYIDNTDAEGRLALADCLTYVKRFRPKLVIDVATLTDACSVALGQPFAGLFSNDDAARDLLMEAGMDSDDLVWPLPIHENHVDQLDDHKAQMRNTGIRAGAGSSAAAFLRHFVHFPWAHVDMAGKAACAVERAYYGRGATGFGARLLIRAAQGFARSYAPGRKTRS